MSTSPRLGDSDPPLNVDPEAGTKEATPVSPHDSTASLSQTPRNRPTLRQRLRRFRICCSLRRNIFDFLTINLCLLTALMIYVFSPVFHEYHIPLFQDMRKSPWGLKYGKRNIENPDSTIHNALISTLVPAGIIALFGPLFLRSRRDVKAGLIGLAYALSTATLLSVLLKTFIGGLRPYFLEKCELPPSALANPLSQVSPGPNDVAWYSIWNVCPPYRDLFTLLKQSLADGRLTAAERAQLAEQYPLWKVRALKDAITSFPSGHAATAFAGLTFLALWLNGKFKPFGPTRRSGWPYRRNNPPSPTQQPSPNYLPSTDGPASASPTPEPPSTTPSTPSPTNAALTPSAHLPRRTAHYKLPLILSPLALATIMSAHKVLDNSHHVADVVGGAVIGAVCALAGYKMVYRALWDTGVNHEGRDGAVGGE